MPLPVLRVPRQLQCQKALRKDRSVVSQDGAYRGRCGECKACWRLFVHEMKKLGKPLPKARRDNSIAGFQFVRRAVQTAPRDA